MKNTRFSIIIVLWCVAFVQCLNAQEPLVSAHRTSYLPNEPITVTFKDGPGNLRDWVGLYNEGAPGGTFLVWQYLDGSQTGKAPLVAGSTTFTKGLPKPGVYELRFYENDLYVLLAESIVVVTNSPRLLLPKADFVPGEAISITFTNGPGNTKDWVGLFVTGESNSAPLAHFYLDGTTFGISVKTSGTVAFNTPVKSGSYEARLFADDTTELLDNISFDVSHPRPIVVATTDGKNVTLSWQAPAWALPIENYVILARRSGTTAYEQIADVAPRRGANDFIHRGLLSGDERCYVVRAQGAAGQATGSSEEVCIAAAVADTGNVLAFEAPPSTRGNEAWPGALGMDFEVVNAISLTHLGVFDDGGDGLKRTLTARLYDRTSKKEIGVLEFSSSSPGVLIGGHRYKTLSASVPLATGFKGAIVVEGYGTGEAAANKGLGTFPLITHDGDGAVLFVGKGRYGRAGVYPINTDAGPANRYAAGSFQFRVTSVTAPGKPIVQSIPDNGSVTLSWAEIRQPLAAAKYRIFRASGPSATFTQIAEITGTEYRDTGLTNGDDVCYRVRAVADTGVAGPDSDTTCQIPDVVAAGVAYINPAELDGNQPYGGSVGNDFDVVRPIRITRLGAFDDQSDGFQRPISVRLYDRTTEKELAKLLFTKADPGELIAGSRFKNLTTPVIVNLGFQGSIVASGYGTGELVGNEGIPGTADLNLETFTGGCLKFVGLSRFGDDPDAFPQIIDGGPANRYAAGTFFFELPAPNAPTPALHVDFPNGNLVLTWTGVATLESADAIAGPWQAAGGASGIVIVPSSGARFYRLR
ncbi:MAG: hypothetical protein EXS31_03665 [Pedosphaera sp.]|nr:hypothetical protein [Pedosphaera sp.]